MTPECSDKDWVRVAIDLLKWTASDTPRCVLMPDQTHLRYSVASMLQKKRVDSLLFLASNDSSAAQAVYDFVWQHQQAALRKVLQCFVDNETPVLVFKSAELVPRYFSSRPLGLLNDLDILIPRQSLALAKRLLFSLGFRQAYYDSDVNRLVDRELADVNGIESSHYELAPFNMLLHVDLPDDLLPFARSWKQHPLWVVDNTCIIIVEIDVHHKVALDIESEPLFARATQSDHYAASTLSVSDHLWFTTSRYYTEVSIYGKNHLRDLAFIAKLAKDPQLDWDCFLAVVKEMDLQASVYYFLAFLDNLSPGLVPRPVLQELHPLTANRLRDFGWQLGKLFDSVEPLPDSLWR